MRRRTRTTVRVVGLELRGRTLMIFVFVIIALIIHGFLLFEQTGALHSTRSYSDSTKSRIATNQHGATSTTRSDKSLSIVVPVWLQHQLTNRKRKFNHGVPASVLSVSATTATCSDDKSIIIFKKKEEPMSHDRNEEVKSSTDQQHILHHRRHRYHHRRRIAVLLSIILLLVSSSSSTISGFPPKAMVGRCAVSINSFFKYHPFIASFLICKYEV